MCVPPICQCTGCLSPAFPAADYGGSARLHTAHHTAHHHPPRTTAVGTPKLLTDSQAVIVCCKMQVSYGLVGVVDIGRKGSKPLVCISTLLHHVTQPHTHIWRGGPTEVSILHGESFLAIGFAYPLFYSLQSRTCDLPNSRTLDGYPLRQNFIIQISGSP